jgi:2-phosphosulfolactate phosphatase
MTQSTASMVPTEQARVFVHLLPKLIPPGALRGGVAVVVDVLRATTVMVHALAAGCEAVIPCGEIDEAKAVAAKLPAGTALLGGERGGIPIPGFELGNSPGDFTPEICVGKTLVMTTTNGTRAILASLAAERVYIASFANLKATADELAVQLIENDRGRPAHIVCAGTEGFISLEDSLLAGALVSTLTRMAFPSMAEKIPIANDEVFITHLEWLGASQTGPVRPLAELLALGRGGRNVKRVGLGADIEAASQVDRFNLVAELRRDPLRIVAV